MFPLDLTWRLSMGIEVLRLASHQHFNDRICTLITHHSAFGKFARLTAKKVLSGGHNHYMSSTRKFAVHMAPFTNITRNLHIHKQPNVTTVVQLKCATDFHLYTR